MPQQIVKEQSYLETIAHQLHIGRLFVVCGGNYRSMPIKASIDGLVPDQVFFSDFTPNPLYEDVCRGVERFNKARCDAILAVGGGSTIDVAKCIKLFSAMDHRRNYLKQEYSDSGIPLIALPTTAGSGSESTQYAVVYFEGQKQTITHSSILPDYAVLVPSVLRTLPIYQKKCTMMDGLCHGIEAWWSVHSTEESREYSKTAVGMILAYMDQYIDEASGEVAEKIMLASNFAGRAINIAQTTAAHAMSYKLTSMLGLPHGHAAAVCLPPLWRYMLRNLDKCVDPRGVPFLSTVFDELAAEIGAADAAGAVDSFGSILKKLGLQQPVVNSPGDLLVLAESVNTVRLKNNPVFLSDEVLLDLYKQLVTVKNHPFDKG